MNACNHDPPYPTDHAEFAPSPLNINNGESWQHKMGEKKYLSSAQFSNVHPLLTPIKL